MPRSSRSSRSSVRGGRKPSGKKRMFHRGEEGMRKVEEELERQKQRREAAAKGGGKVFRFFVPVGETKEIIILDDAPDFYMYEHTLKNPQTKRWDLHVPCIKEWDNCPVCEEVGESYYAMFLTVLDLTPYTDKDGNRHEYSRKLMVVKPSQQKKFIRRFRKDGTLRGALFECSRDGQKDAAIGNDIEFVEFVDEEELDNDYIRVWTDKDGKEHEDNLAEPFDYEEMFEEPTAEELRAIVGGEPPPGSSAHTRKALEEDDDADGWDDDSDDDVPWEDEEEEEKPRRSGRSSRSGRSGRSEKRSEGRSSRRAAGRSSRRSRR